MFIETEKQYLVTISLIIRENNDADFTESVQNRSE